MLFIEAAAEASMRGYQPNLSQGTFFQLTPPISHFFFIHLLSNILGNLVTTWRWGAEQIPSCQFDWNWLLVPSPSGATLILLQQDLLHFFFNCCCCTEVPNNQMDNHKVHAVDIKWHFLSEVFAKVFLYLLIRRKENWYPVIKMVKWCMWHVPDMWSGNRIPAYPHL